MSAVAANPEYYLYHIRDRENSCGFGHDGYIGITNNPYRRQRQHFNKLKAGTHENERLQYEYKKANGNLEFRIFNRGTKAAIEARERLLVPKANHHLNRQRGGGASRGLALEQALNVIKESERSSQQNGANTESTQGASSEKKTDTAKQGAGLSPALAVFADAIAATAVTAATAASGLGAAYGLSKTVLKDDPSLEQDERDARAAGRIGAYGGGVVGAGGAVAMVCLSGEIGLGVAGIGSGLTAIGGAVGGAAATGAAVTLAIPAAAACVVAGVGYGGYKLYKWMKSPS